jgi:hypothetical protein
MKRSFQLLLPAILSSACASAPPPPDIRPKGTEAAEVSAPTDVPVPTKATVKIHPGEAWYFARAEWIGITPDQAKTRDGAISTEQAPEGFWDEQSSTEAAGLWTAYCNDCHGGRRRVADAKLIPAPPVGWGHSAGYFFGKEKKHEEIFRTIFAGVSAIKPGANEDAKMPAWGARLSREQIWSLVYFIEVQSGSTAGTFPPGLYPQQRKGE